MMRPLQRVCTDSRFKGAGPTKASISRRVNAPSSGMSASRAATLAGPMPHTMASWRASVA